SFQVPRLFGSMSVIENMLIARFADFRLDYRKDYDSATHKARQLLEMAELHPLRDKPAKILSGGQKALLQIVRGFMVENISVYLLDEPFAGVNVVVKETIMKVIEQMRQAGVTFLLVSHEMASVRRMCSRVTVMAQGARIAEGSMEEVAANPQVIDAYLGGKSEPTGG
ncbi:MAG: ATP-binding cassette domain-containing protein, partial [Chloroflexota bacterium]